MRTMYDSVTVADDPAGATMLAGYADGHYANMPELARRFPHARLVSIATDPQTDALALDCENGDATPAQCPTWAARQWAAGRPGIIYCNTATAPAVLAQFDAHNLRHPPLGLAQYDNDPDWGELATRFPTMVWKQYGGNLPGHYDVNSVADYIPGIDPAPEDDMADFDILAALQNATVPMTAQGGVKRSLLDLLQAAAFAQLAASRIAAINPAAITQAVVAALGPGDTHATADIEGALRTVFGSLDNT